MFADKTSLLLAAYDVSGRLHLYKIEPKWDVKIPKAGQPPKHIEKPELIVSEICTEEICCPTGAMPTGNLDTAPSSNIMLSAQLTHLNFLPKTPEQDDGTLPTVQAIFCTPAAVQPFAQTQPHQEACSIIVRWEVQRTQQNQLHSSLDLVTSKKKSVSSVAPREELSLKRLPDLLLHSVVLTFQPFWYNMLLAYCYSDGTIEFRKRSTMEILGPDENNETLTSIFQAGFSFPQLEPSLHVALSPNYCLAACMQQDGTIKLRSMEYTYGSLSADDGDPKHSAALAALVLHCASGTNQYSSTDDIFAVMGDLSEKSKDEFLTVMFQGLNANLDCSSDESLSGNVLMLLGRSPFFAKTLSAVNLLGLKGAIERTVPSKVAWIILNIKFITQLITTITRLHGQPLDKSLVRPDMVPQLLGIVRWIVSFMTYMVDELFAVGYELQGLSTSPLNKAAIADTVAALNKPAILVLLCSFPRMMMRSWSGSLTWAFNTASRMSVQGPTVEMRRLYAPLHHALAEMPFDWRVFDTLLAETHALVRQTYQRLNLNEEQRNAAERELIRGKFPDALVPAAKWLLTDALFEKMQSGPPLADKVDVAKIVFFDTTWLGLTDSRSARRWHATHVVDVVQKMVIRGAGAQRLPVPGAKRQSVGPDGVKKEGGVLDAGAGGKREKDRLRRCTRCASWMEDVYVGMPGYTSQTAGWVVNVGRHCVCGNAWSLVEGPFP
jgi:mediator of RNA polymerase II transcription subunit 16